MLQALASSRAGLRVVARGTILLQCCLEGNFGGVVVLAAGSSGLISNEHLE